jgi:hypothetical protein
MIVNYMAEQYETVPENNPRRCDGCAFLHYSGNCINHLAAEESQCSKNRVVFERLKVCNITPIKPPSISLSFDLDLSTVSLPEVFKVKSLRLSTLDDALAKGTDAFTISTKDVPQETIEAIAQALAVEFLRRHSKV